MPYHPRTCSLLYSASCLLDALDGAAARRLGQSTQFGAVLDMIIDRCTTTCLLVFLATAFPRWSILFQALISLDYSSHYIHMYATLAMGGQRQSHKDIDKSRPWVMRAYYSNRVSASPFFNANIISWYIYRKFCLLSARWMRHFSLRYICFHFLRHYSCLHWRTAKQALQPPPKSGVRLGVLGLWKWLGKYSSGSSRTAGTDISFSANKISSSAPWFILAVSSSFMLFKQYVNVIQLVEASRWLAQGDVETRRTRLLQRKTEWLGWFMFWILSH